MHSFRVKATAVAFGGMTLVGCAAHGELSATGNQDVQRALSVACPILVAVQSSNLPLNIYQKSALLTLALACPPNPPPSSAIIAAADIAAAYAVLQPLLRR